MKYSIKFEQKGSQGVRVHTVYTDDFRTAEVAAEQLSIQFDEAILDLTEIEVRGRSPIHYKHGMVAL